MDPKLEQILACVMLREERMPGKANSTTTPMYAKYQELCIMHNLKESTCEVLPRSLHKHFKIEYIALSINQIIWASYQTTSQYLKFSSIQPEVSPRSWDKDRPSKQIIQASYQFGRLCCTIPEVSTFIPPEFTSQIKGKNPASTIPTLDLLAAI
ncbi:uncharacterized protein MELLADRAFT_106422 [Melampsora larici-populina 98AG31]|uniref:Uncharacterized protein n=1 Tax=Melampsora larici-populina (strain 98AG31 / pathotype 3-4-7) TaxID=747676 RepID=F4RLB9_MELLP|nr:uncharacterized protein MELLADRAFT_106422 [Melampsora larici-populina 98AG31]EGG06899.1 hypothetical protein MELLADRAFT_106422 [Melampsora larici-populina 98AG31]